MISKFNDTFRRYCTQTLCLILITLWGCAGSTPVLTPESVSPDIEDAVRQSLSVHFIDVGQGSAILVEAPEKTVLIDGGERGSSVPAYLRGRKIDTLDVVVGTHPHSDHIGGLIEVLRQFRVLEVIDPAVPHTTKTYEDYLNSIRDRNTRFTVGRAGLKYDLGGGVLMKVLHPHAPRATRLNDASIVIQLVFDEVSFLLAGDAEEASEREMMRKYRTLKSTILLAGHHGSRTSSSAGFIAMVRPELAVIMAGKGNRYGHPHSETVRTFERFDVKVYRTDQMGTVVVHSDGRAYKVETKGASSSLNRESKSGYYGTASSESAESVSKININSADHKTLQQIIHIGPARASEIIRKRPFRSLSDLRRVRGISIKRLRIIQEEGRAYVQ